MIKEGSSILDLGCGNGTLMQMLRDERKCNCTGIEISPSGVDACKSKGLHVVQGSIDQPLQYKSRSFDYAVCNVTLQMVHKPEVVLAEMSRVAKYSIISFPNFGYLSNRIELLLKGKMPAKMLFGYSWYNTGHIHQFSVNDFNEMIMEMKAEIEEIRITPSGSKLIDLLGKAMPSLFAFIPIYRVKNAF